MPLPPPQNGATEFTRYEFGGGDANNRFNDEFDLNPQTLFFEGDLGSIYSGFSGNESSFDLPFTVGLFPLFLQNGIWANDAILGGAVSIPAKNSAALGLANFDVTFFAAFDDVDNAGIIGPGNDSNANLFGVTAFVDAFNGYLEGGYAVIDATRTRASSPFRHRRYTRRYATPSRTRPASSPIHDNPQGDSDGRRSSRRTASFTLEHAAPYANFFVGFGNPNRWSMATAPAS